MVVIFYLYCYELLLHTISLVGTEKGYVQVLLLLLMTANGGNNIKVD